MLRSSDSLYDAIASSRQMTSRFTSKYARSLLTWCLNTLCYLISFYLFPLEIMSSFRAPALRVRTPESSDSRVLMCASRTSSLVPFGIPRSFCRSDCWGKSPVWQSNARIL